MVKRRRLLMVIGGIWLLLILVIVVLNLSIEKNTQSMQEGNAVIYDDGIVMPEMQLVENTVEEEVSTVEYVQSKFTEDPLTLENIYTSLSTVGISDYTAETVAYIFSLDCADVRNWYLTYNDGYCPTISLYVNDDEHLPYITVMEFKNNCYVAHRDKTDDYIFCRDGASMQYTRLIAESVRDMLNDWQTDWEWNCYDAICAWGLMETLFPNVEKSVADNAIVIEGKGVMTFGKACLFYENGVYSLYDKVETKEFEPKENWHLAESFTYEDLLLWFEANEFEVPWRFEETFTEHLYTPTDFWYGELVSGQLTFYDVIVDTSEPDGYRVEPFLMYDYNELGYDFME